MRKMGCYGQRAVLAAHGTTATDGYPTKPEANRINSAQWRGDKSAEVIHQLATYSKPG